MPKRTAPLTVAVLAYGILASASLSLAQTGCVPGPETLCLLSGRFQVEVDWRNQHGGGVMGAGRAMPQTDLSGVFWFFSEENIELVVKALDGRPVNGRYWFFYGALSDVEYWIRVTDTITGTQQTYHNPPGNICGRGDTAAFAAPAAGATTGSLVLAPASIVPMAPVAEPTSGPSGSAKGSCIPGAETLCLLDGRFRVTVDWRNQHAERATGTGKALVASDLSGYFWFFSRDNIELVVKALDGRAFNDRYWFFYGALSDVEYWIHVTDAVTGAETIYHNPPGNVCGRGDTSAFCDVPEECGAKGSGPLLASTPVQIDPEDSLIVAFRDFDLASDVDVVSLHQDFYGIPWQEFAAGEKPPEFWASRIDGAKALAARWAKPIYLSLALVDGDGRAFLAARAVDSPNGLTTQQSWSERCFNLSTDPDGPRWRQAYLGYVRYMVEKFRPRYLTIGIEINLFQKACDSEDPSAYDALVSLHNEAYDLARSLDAGLIIFPSLQIDFVIDSAPGGECFQRDPAPCIERNLARSAGLKRDRFAISLYPHLIELADVEVDYSTYIDAVLQAVSPEPAVVAETGYLSAPFLLNVGTSQEPACVVLFEFSDARQRAYFDAVVDAAQRWGMELLTWWSNRDVLPDEVLRSCPCQDSRGFCELLDAFRQAFGLDGEILFKAFSSMGVRDYDGSGKPILERWREVRGQ